MENILSEPLDNDVNLFWRQGVLDILVTYPIDSEDSQFSVNRSWALCQKRQPLC